MIQMGTWNVSEMEHNEQFVLLPNGNGESVFGESRVCQRMLWYAAITTVRSYSSIGSKARWMSTCPIGKKFRKYCKKFDVFRQFFFYISIVPHGTFWSESDIIENSATRSRIIFCRTARRKLFRLKWLLEVKRKRYEYSHRLEVFDRHICSYKMTAMS